MRPSALALAVLLVACAGDPAPAPTPASPPAASAPAPTPTPARAIAEVPEAAKKLAAYAAASRSVDCPVEAREGLLDLRARFPGDPTVDAPLIAAQRACKDWRGMAATLASRPPAGVAPALLGKVYLQAGEFDRAVAALEPVLAANPDDADARWALGMALFELGRHAEARPHLEAVADAQAAEGEADALVLLGIVQRDAGDAAAAATLERAVEVEPTDLSAWNALGRTRARAGDEVGAAEAFAKAEAIQAVASRIEAERIRLSGLVASLKSAYAERRFSDAEELIEAIFPLAEPSLRASLYEMRASILTAQGDTASAAEAGRRADAIRSTLEP